MNRRHPKSWSSLRQLFPEFGRTKVRAKPIRGTTLSIHQLEDRVVPTANVTNLALNRVNTNTPPTITATVTESISTKGINAAEYFLDIQPAATVRGTAMSAVDGKFGGNTEAVIGTVTSTQFSALPDGVHTINVRGRTKSGEWGSFVPVTFTKDTMNDAPVFGAFNTTPHVLKTRAVSVPVSVTDPDSTALTYTLAGAPAWATINSSTGQISLTPGLDVAAGTYQFAVVVTDNGLLGDGARTSSRPPPPWPQPSTRPGRTAPTCTCTARRESTRSPPTVRLRHRSRSVDRPSRSCSASWPTVRKRRPSPSRTPGRSLSSPGTGTNHVAVTGAISSDLRGGDGEAYLRGGSGNDTLTGFAGADGARRWCR